jgi:hypothetical protein
VIQVLGLPQALATFGKMAVQGAVAAEATEELLGQSVAGVARAKVPVLSGETKDSIVVTDEGVEAGGAALYLEFGTVNMPAEPFLRPAADVAETFEPALVALASRILGGL